jgi:hypothetical protein
MNKLIGLRSLLFLLACFPYQGNAQVKDYYNIPDTLTFDSIQYKLSASYHPKEIYYKQEYIPDGESADHFNTMVTIDFLITDVPAKNLLVSKVKELIERKKNDPIVQYEMRYNKEKDDFILDFTLSKDIESKAGLVERNVYKYMNYIDSAGHKGVLVFAISQRGYGDNIAAFFGKLKNTRTSDIKKLGQYHVPNIMVK